MITLVALACGLAAIEATRVGAWDTALRFILVAAIADGVDGTVARKLGAVSPMGTQLDSLADIVAFGVAPAFLFATYFADAPDPARYGVVLAFVGAGTYRLARFHAQPGGDAFQGLPITIAGALLAIAVAGPFGGDLLLMSVIGIGLAVLMVTRQPFPKFSRWKWTLMPGVLVATVIIAAWPRAETVAILSAILLSVYVAWSLVAAFVPRVRREKRPHEGRADA